MMYVKSVQAVSMQMKLAQKFDKKVHLQTTKAKLQNLGQQLSYKTWAKNESRPENEYKEKEECIWISK